MDIGSGNKYPSNSLSNFSPHPFTLDGVECYSMEGFLQSLKFESIEMQRHVCTLVGIAAKRKGRNKKWFKKQELYWCGETYKRDSLEYQNLLNRAFNAMYKCSPSFRNALKASGKSTLTHSIGKTDPRSTVLTIKEFCSRLRELRECGILPVLVEEDYNTTLLF